jgi:thioredoxin reductase
MKPMFDVIIIGGSYAGMAAAMALGRARKQVLIIDNGMPCNNQTPRSHNFLTQDGNTPAEIAAIAKQQLAHYPTITILTGLSVKGTKTANGFEIQINSGEIFAASRLVFATGIRDMLPAIKGMDECWGISVLHCPFCHGYEVCDEMTGIFGNGESAYQLAVLISNWTDDLTVFTNGASYFTIEQSTKLQSHGIRVIEKEIAELVHQGGYVQQIIFKDGTTATVKAAYIRSPFRQSSQIPEAMGCAITPEGYIKTDEFQETTVTGIFACGDNTNKLRTLANAVASGTTTGMSISKQLISLQF